MVITLNTTSTQTGVGQVDLPIVLNAEAQAYLNAIPTTAAALTYNKKKALNNAFAAIKSNGLTSKITALNIPLFGRVEGGVNLMNPAQNIGFPTAGATYDSKGVTFSLGWESLITSDKTNIHIGFYNTTANTAPDSTSSQSSVEVGSFGPFISRGVASGNGGRDVGFNTAMGVIPSSLNHRSSIGVVIGVLDVPNVRTFAIIDSELTTVGSLSGLTPLTGSPKIILGGSTAGTNAGIAQYAHGLFTFGTAMSTSEATLYGSILTTLMTALTAA